MTDELIKELRDAHFCDPTGYCGECAYVWPCAPERAALELRRLRTENEEAIQQRDKMVTRALALQANLEAALAICDRRGDDTRMRAALTGEATA